MDVQLSQLPELGGTTGFGVAGVWRKTRCVCETQIPLAETPSKNGNFSILLKVIV